MILVVDAGVAVKWFVEESLRNYAFDLIAPEISRIAPDLIFSEVGNALWTKMRRGEVSSGQARLAIASLEGFFDQIVGSEEIAVRALEIGETLDHPIYDCFYLACVEHVGGQLVTDDARLIKKAQEAGMSEVVIALSEFSPDGLRDEP
jgi:predicted nucleic acid-binding protein